MESVLIGSHVLYPGRQLLLADERVHLGARALAILSLLAENANQVVTKDALLEEVWAGVIVEENALQVHIAALRKALGEDNDRIETVRGIGYILHVNEGEAHRSAEVDRSAEDSAFNDNSEIVNSPRRKAKWPLVVFLGAILLALAAAFYSWTRGEQSSEVAIAVLPIVAASNSPADAALASGITDELVLRLRRIESLRVATAQSADNRDVPIFKGTLQSDDQALRIVARLERADGTVIWSDSYDREITALLDVQEEIARSIAGALSVPLNVGLENKANGGTDNPEAYANYVQARANRHNPDRSVPTRLLERALALDPDYVKALSEITFADGLSLYFVRDTAEVTRLQARMETHSRRALESNPEVWQAHAARGWFDLMEKDFASADKAHARVVELDHGNDPEILETLANFQAQLGRQKATFETRAAKSTIDPFFSDRPYPPDYLMVGDFEGVIKAFEAIDIADIRPDGQAHPVDLYWALRLSGRVEQAQALARRVAGDNPDLQHYERLDYAGWFKNASYEELKRFADEQWGAGGRDNLSELSFHASQLGNHRLALDYLTLAFMDREAMGGYFRIWHPALAPTRQTPEFADWIEELGMVEAWRESGDWGDFCRPVNGESIACK